MNGQTLVNWSGVLIGFPVQSIDSFCIIVFFTIYFCFIFVSADMETV